MSGNTDIELSRTIDPVLMGEGFDRILGMAADGYSPKKIAKELGVKYFDLYTWIFDDPVRLGRYHEAQRLWAEKLHGEVIEIADSATNEDVNLARLRIEARFRVASNYDRNRFGQQMKIEHNHVNVDIKKLIEDRTRAIEGECEVVKEDGRVMIEVEDVEVEDAE